MLLLETKNFKSEVVESKTPVFVDFWSIGCGPCRMMDPTIKALESKMTNVKFAKIEASDGGAMFSEHRVTHIPTFIIFKDGKETSRKSGLMSEADAEKWINSNI